jgi:hypothetical protein
VGGTDPKSDVFIIVPWKQLRTEKNLGRGGPVGIKLSRALGKYTSSGEKTRIPRSTDFREGFIIWRVF